ncbi:MAG: hypothetical protein ACOX7N_02275 [Lawsonibacter sp.]|jgi:hypothetical protein
MEKRKWILVALCGALGGVLALIGWGMASAGDMTIWAAPFLLVGKGLRKLALAGFWGNVGAWVLVMLVCLLPLGGLLVWKHGRKRLWQVEDLLAFLAAPVLFALLYYAVNPTLLPEPLGRLYPVAAGGCVLSLAVAWGVLKLLRGMETCPQERLVEVCSPALMAGGGLVAFSAVYTHLTLFLTESQSVLQGNTGDPQGAQFTSFMLGILAVLEVTPYLLGAIALMWGASFVQELRDGFGPKAVERCQRTALGCKLVVQASVMLTVSTNLLQLALFGQMRSTHFSVYIPVFPLLICAGLYFLCRLVYRGRQLQEDSDSII